MIYLNIALFSPKGTLILVNRWQEHSQCSQSFTQEREGALRWQFGAHPGLKSQVAVSGNSRNWWEEEESSQMCCCHTEH